ncbi:MAG: hypothetical protein AAGB51_06725 [Planctomycetota bacterium]
MIGKSFVDLLFILLLGTLVMLSRSIEVGSLDTAPAEVGTGGSAPENIDRACVVVVGDESVGIGSEEGIPDADAASRIEAEQWVLLVPAHESLSHHRMMAVWSVMNDAGYTVKLGVRSTGVRAEGTG